MHCFVVSYKTLCRVVCIKFGQTKINIFAFCYIQKYIEANAKKTLFFGHDLDCKLNFKVYFNKI